MESKQSLDAALAGTADVDPYAGLRCAISLEPYQDPVLVPCCGQTFSRQSLIDAFAKKHGECPLCRCDLVDLFGYDASKAARNIMVADMVETVDARLAKLKRAQQGAARSIGAGVDDDGKGDFKSNERQQDWSAQLLRLPLAGGIGSELSNSAAASASASASGDYALVDASLQQFVGHLKLTCSKPSQSLLLFVVDRSGSMSTQPTPKHIAPITHVKYSLQQFLNVAYNHPELLTKLILYNDKATTTDIDIVRKPMKHYADIVDAIVADGGTSFQAAFDQIGNLAREYKDNDDVLALSVMFLTDGEDSDANTRAARDNLVAKFKLVMQGLWKKQFTMHTVGFGSQHDEVFLNKLRCVGTAEGAYRYADPLHDTDSLSSKINSLLSVIKRAPGLVLRLVDSGPYPVLSGQNNTYWLNLLDGKIALTAPTAKGDDQQHAAVDAGESKGDVKLQQSPRSLRKVYEIKVQSSNGQTWTIRPEVLDATRLQLEQWQSHLIDEIATEMVQVAALLADNKADKKAHPGVGESKGESKIDPSSSSSASMSASSLPLTLHCELLHQRIRGIMPKLSADSANLSRLEELAETLQSMRKGEQVNQLRLSDMQFEGQFATKRATVAHEATESKHRGAVMGTNIKKESKEVKHAASFGPSSAWQSSLTSKRTRGWNTVDYKFVFKAKSRLRREAAERKKQAQDNKNKGDGDGDEAETDSKEEEPEEPDIWKLLVDGKNAAFADWLAKDNNSAKWVNIKEAGDSLLIAASGVGRVNVVKMLLDTQAADVSELMKMDQTDSDFNALDVAVCCGWSSTARLLLDSGWKPYGAGGEQLLYTCLSKGYFATASELLSHKIVTLDPSMLDTMPAGNHECFEWLTKRMDSNVSLETAIVKGLADVVAERIAASPAAAAAETKGDSKQQQQSAKATVVKPLSLAPFWRALFVETTPDHVRIVEMLLEHKLIDVNEDVSLTDAAVGAEEDTFETGGTKSDPKLDMKLFVEDDKTVSNLSKSAAAKKEWTWPLFAVCERGNKDTALRLVKLLMKHGADLSKRNHKGTSAVWIAACNRHLDILETLLEAGHDLDVVNLANAKGDSPLIPACHKGSEQIASLLLDAGSRLDVFNPDRDSAAMICCRTGQAKILDMILSRCESQDVKDKQLRLCARIDGFNPLLAAAEVEKVECLRVCVKHGAELDFRTASDNQILPGANALHLACWYGRLNALKLLVGFGGDLKAGTTGEGLTPLHLAVKKGHASLVRYILSVRSGKESASVADRQGRLPRHYASMASNTAILDEFFSNTLGVVLQKVLEADSKTQETCSKVDRSRVCNRVSCSLLIVLDAQMLAEHGRSFGCFEYQDIAQTEIGSTSSATGESFLVQSIVSGSSRIVETLVGKMGIDLSRPDARSGIPPAFWSKLFLPRTGSLMTSSALVDSMIGKVQAVCKQSLLNKFLLSATATSGSVLGSTRALLASAATTTVQKMSEGYSANVKVELVRFLSAPTQQSETQSLMGFLGSLRKSKQASTIDAVLWDAKMHLIKTIAAPETVTSRHGQESKALRGGETDGDTKSEVPTGRSTTCDTAALEPAHMLALYLFTGTAFFHQQVNTVLSRWSDQNAWHPFVVTLHQAVSRLPVCTREVFRAVDIGFDAKALAIGARVKWSAFSTCSLEWQHATDLLQRKRGVVFIVHSQTGRLVGRYARNSVDGEVLFLPGTEFQVTAYYRPNVIALGQANIRNKSYPAFTRHLDRAIAGTACLLVELREVSAASTSSATTSASASMGPGMSLL
jgi:ankyrin repeat protein/Mg-chelatase subunit ChlD